MRFWAMILAAAIGSTLLTACMSQPLPYSTVRNFLLAWQSGHYDSAAAETTGQPRVVVAALKRAADQLDASDLQMKIGRVESHANSATADFVATMWLGAIGRRWEYQGRMRLHRDDGTWKILWAPTVIHPRLGKGQRLAVVTGMPTRAPLLDADGRPLVEEQNVVTVGVRPDALRHRNHTLRVLAAATDVDPKRLVAAVSAARPDAFVPVTTVRYATYTRIRSDIDHLPGVVSHAGTLPLPPSPTFAQALLGRVGPATADALQQVGPPHQPGDVIGLSGLQLAFQSRLAGTPGSKVVAQDESGHQVAVLATFPGRSSAPVRTTLDRSVQRAAERALRGVGKPAALVAVQASTGKVLAVANRPAGSSYDRALAGRYAPGSAFQIVSTEALLRHGLKPSMRVTCPSRRIAGGRPFSNHRGEGAPGSPTFRTNFATSCDTAFIGLSRELEDDALQRATAMFGLGSGWELAVPAFTGSVPAPKDDAEKAADIVGRGAVRVSPLDMALVAAAVDSGTWRPPVLVTDPPQRGTAHTVELPEEDARVLRSLMGETVTSGVGRAAYVPGRRVYGKPGTAASGSGEAANAWFVGFSGDLAFAVLVEGGGTGGEVAAPIAGAFLRALGSAYAASAVRHAVASRR